MSYDVRIKMYDTAEQKMMIAPPYSLSHSFALTLDEFIGPPEFIAKTGNFQGHSHSLASCREKVT